MARPIPEDKGKRMAGVILTAETGGGAGGGEQWELSIRAEKGRMRPTSVERP